jgi:hypothetical protein
MPDRAQSRAGELEARIELQAAAIVLPTFREVLASIRVYLLKHNKETGNMNNVHKLLKERTGSDAGFISLGPEFDQGPTESHYKLKSKTRLSFGITLREANGRCKLISYRFHLHLGTARGPSFLRFELNRDGHQNPLFEPRSHVHPGSDDIRLPFPVLKPVELLDRIFYVIENPAFPNRARGHAD